MNTQALNRVAASLMSDSKGLLAMDESNPTCNKRFAALGISQSEEMRREYRELIVTTEGLGQSISGAILFDETIHQKLSDGSTFVEALERAGITPGIKVDKGAKALALFPGEKVTEGLDGLAARVHEYVQMGAKFAKWRAVITIGQGLPTQGCLDANAQALARYAAICQEGGLVPIVEPEVIMDGDHSLQRCFDVTGQVLHTVFQHQYDQRVALDGMLLKPNMVLPGEESRLQESVEAVADATVTCLLRHVPAAVPGVAFLSGGQSPQLASARLSAMNERFANRLPWALTFSYSRAIQQPALEAWRGDRENVAAAQAALKHRADCNRAARQGKYDERLKS